jgi:zinc protease
MSGNSLPGPDNIARFILDNGVVLLARANDSSPSVVLQGYLAAGSLLDTDEKLGLADFTAAALMRGTQRHSFQELYDELESVGASLGFSGGTHTTGFSANCLAEDLEMVAGLLAEALRYPVFPAEEVKRLRAQLLTGLAIRAQDTAQMASLAFEGLVYAGHPYRRPDDGYPETIAAITAGDLADFHQTSYGPRGCVISLTGAVEPQRAAEILQRALADWQNPAQRAVPALPELQPLSQTVFRQVVIPGKSQADLLVGASGPGRTSADFLAAALGNDILGQFGMMGRVGQVVREQAGLAYYADSSLDGGPGPGPWCVAAGVDPQNVDQAIELITQEIARFTRELVDEEELSDSQAHFVGRLPVSLESNAGVSGALINLERYQLGLDYYQRYPGLVGSITREDVLQAARRYLDPSRLGIAVAGP